MPAHPPPHAGHAYAAWRAGASKPLLALGLVLASGLASGCLGGSNGPPAELLDAAKDCDFASTGRNRFLILEPGWTLRFQDGSDQLTVTVLDETRIVGGVETRVVTEEETSEGQLVEISRNFFALCRRTGDVFYFGEDVDIYEGGRVTSHDGAWLSGLDGATPGIMMPAAPAVGSNYYQEWAPDVALDHAEVVSVDETLDTPAGRFTGVVKVKETTRLEPGTVGFKWHAPGVGLVRDDSFQLVSSGQRP